MYERYFGLKRTPFRLESEPDMFFSGENQSRILKAISSSLKQRKGIITLSGLPGTGKTTVVRRAVEAYISPSTIVCRVNRANTEDILQEIKDELNPRLYPSVAGGKQKEISEIIATAVKERKHILVVIDEAQQLSKEQVRSLYDLVLSELSLIAYFKFLLIGHEDLDELFDLDQLGRREISISEHCQMLPLKSDEISAYIKHRLSITGWSGNPELKDDIYEYIFRITKGVPRRINSFFDRLLLFSYMESSKSIDKELLKTFSVELYEELEEETHPDLDSHDLRQALRCEKKEFESATVKPKPKPEIVNAAEAKAPSHEAVNKSESKPAKTEKATNKEDKSNLAKPNIKLVKNDSETEASTIKPSKTPEQQKQGQLIELVSNYLENPERFKHYSDEFYQLPKDIGTLLQLATEKDPAIEKAIPTQLMSLMPHEVRRMIRHFLRRILLTSSDDPYRIIGLNASASEQDINQHFDYLMRICRSDIGGPSEWSKADENAIKQAYIKILGSNSQIEKAAAIPMEAADPHIDKKSDDELTSDKQSKAKNAEPEIPAQALLAEIRSNSKANKPDAKTNSEDSANKKPEHQAVDIPKLLKNKADDSQAKPTNEVPVLINSIDEPTLKLTKVETKNNKLVPLSIAAGVGVVAIGLVVFFMSGDDSGKVDNNQELVIPEKKPEYPEIQLLSKNAVDKQKTTSANNKDKDENLITKILTQTEAPKPEKSKPEKPKTTKPVTPPAKTTASKPTATAKPVKQEAPTPKKPAQAPKVASKPTPVVKKTEAVKPPTVKAETQTLKKVATATTAPVATAATATSEAKTAEPVVNQQPSAKPTFVNLTDADLGRLVFYFKRSYETGDISIFGDLFTEDAITNESANRKQIVRDYSALFEVTNKRVIELNDLAWKIDGESATGNGKFLLAITENENTPTEEIQGEISIKAEKVDHKAKIKELFYRYSFAEN